MRIKFKILHPQSKDQSVDYDTIINYDRTSSSDRGRSLYEVFSGGNYFYTASGSGYNFDDIFLGYGLNVEDYYQVSAYNVTSLTATIIAKESYRWSHAVFRMFPQGSLKDYFKNRPKKSEMPIYEWVPKSGKGRSVIVFGPPEVEQNLNLMNSKTIHSEYIELPSEEALEYFTGESIFLLKKTDVIENLEALLGDTMSPELKKVIDNFRDGYHFGMWCTGSIEDRFQGDPNEFPWAKKVSEIQAKMREVINKPGRCEFMKFLDTKRLIKSL